MTKPELIQALRKYTRKDVLDFLMTWNEKDLETLLAIYQIL